MDSKIFGSFSYTSFVDLYDSHLSSWYDTAHLLEVIVDKETDKIVILTHTATLSEFSRQTHDSYLVGILYDSQNTDVQVDIGVNNIEFSETHKERKKVEYLEFRCNDGYLTLETGQRNHMYVDEYFSFSSLPLNHFESLQPNVTYSLDIHEVSWNTFGAMEGYGSRNKLKKMVYPQYDKSV